MPLIYPPKVVVFDNNGTILDDLHVAYGSVCGIFEAYDLTPPTLERYREEITADFMEFYYAHGFERGFSRKDKEGDAEEINKFRRRFYEDNADNARIRSGVYQTLNWLSVIPFNTAIVSAEIATTLYRALIRNGVQRKFDFIRPESWGDKSKALLQTAEVFGCSPREMIYIDDTESGLISARNAGVVPVAFTNPTGYNSKERLLRVTDVNIDEISDLKALLITA